MDAVRKDGNAIGTRKAKVPRIANALQSYVAKLNSTRKKSENILAMPIDGPDQFDGKFPLTKFSKDLIKPYCHTRCHQCDTRELRPYTAYALIDEEFKTEEEILSRVCYLRDGYVGALLKLFCIEDETSRSIVVDKPSAPIGSVTALELPVG